MGDEKYFPLVLDFEKITKKDIALVGGKNASLGELINKTKIPVPPGFAITSKAYKLFVEYNGIDKKIKQVLKKYNIKNLEELKKAGKEIRNAFLKGKFPEELKVEIEKAYRQLGRKVKEDNPLVAVRSSATLEDIENASFAGQQETYLGVKGIEEVLEKTKRCFASLYTNRAISYREDMGFSQLDVYLSVGVQYMVRSDLACSGVMFTLDPNSGFRNVVCIEASYGLGEFIVQGKVIPDTYYVFKPTLAIVSKELGEKKVKCVFKKGAKGTSSKPVEKKERERYVLKDEEIKKLAEYAIAIERYYKRPMDIEWAKDGLTGNLYIVQARPETVHSAKKELVIENYVLKEKSRKLVEGLAIGRKIGVGKINVIRNVKDIGRFQKGEILVTEMTNPDWEPIMKIASGIVTEKGGITSHAAIVSRELGVPCIVGAEKATSILKTGMNATLDCTSEKGIVWEGKLKYEIKKVKVSEIPKTKTKVMLILGTPEQAFDLAFLPADGVGLAREENIIASWIKMHPLYAIEKGKEKFYVDKLAEGIGRIASAFYPKEVTVRFSDFKTNEYANLEGGRKYEPTENNPMLGWRGASRYISKEFRPAFELELKAMLKVRDEFGLKNISLLVPFCRTLEEAEAVIDILKEHGLKRKTKVYVMAEIPSNIILAEKFAKLFDGFSIGSNDLTQLTLGMDRDNEKLKFDERNEAVLKAIEHLIKIAKKKGKYVGICGQAPSEYPEYVTFLVKHGIDSISVNPDVFLRTKYMVAKVEREIKKG